MKPHVLFTLILMTISFFGCTVDSYSSKYIGNYTGTLVCGNNNSNTMTIELQEDEPSDLSTLNVTIRNSNGFDGVYEGLVTSTRLALVSTTISQGEILVHKSNIEMFLAKSNGKECTYSGERIK